MNRRVAKKEKNANAARFKRRRARIRKRVIGTTERPRLSVRRSVKHIYAQIVDDSLGKTLAFVGSCSKDAKGTSKSEKARWVGETLAEKAKGQGITKIVFDRGGRQFHGRVKALADGARESGLEF
ncbi:MAG: 50S ribosomal protein L18 [Candidatus Lindowbacteria bacterium]|nr:50S ribosomal protein L18 [Candidatus Lindowbacteria bacterium]